jgi:uncharacterized protein YjiS (DUF1127 family)
MNRLTTLPVSQWPLRQNLLNIGSWLRGWLARRRNARVLAQLSPEQMRDCGIEPPERNVPTIEVPKELMRRLPSRQLMG